MQMDVDPLRLVRHHCFCFEHAWVEVSCDLFFYFAAQFRTGGLSLEFGWQSFALPQAVLHRVQRANGRVRYMVESGKKQWLRGLFPNVVGSHLRPRPDLPAQSTFQQCQEAVGCPL